MIRSLAFALAALAIPVAGQATITAFQDTGSLDRAVAAFTGRAIGEDGGAIATVDPRLKLAQCPTLALSWHGPGHDAVVVNCTGPEWRVFVPVRVIAAPPAALAAASPVAAAIKPAIVIKRGDPVTVEAAADGFSITRDGVAMGDAPAGGRLMIKVDDKKPPVQAVAIEGGRATLPGWND